MSYTYTDISTVGPTKVKKEIPVHIQNHGLILFCLFIFQYDFVTMFLKSALKKFVDKLPHQGRFDTLDEVRKFYDGTHFPVPLVMYSTLFILYPDNDTQVSHWYSATHKHHILQLLIICIPFNQLGIDTFTIFIILSHLRNGLAWSEQI